MMSEDAAQRVREIVDAVYRAFSLQAWADPSTFLSLRGVITGDRTSGSQRVAVKVAVWSVWRVWARPPVMARRMRNAVRSAPAT